jgi:uncharacterized protein
MTDNQLSMIHEQRDNARDAKIFCGGAMLVKRFILSLLTVWAIVQIGFSLNNSFSQPQIQSRLELYQINLVLHVSELKTEVKDNDNIDVTKAIDSLIGESPYSAASKQYDKALKEAKASLDTFQSRLQQLQANNSNLQTVADTKTNSTLASQQQLIKEIKELENFIAELEIKQGILKAAQNDRSAALEIWQKVDSNKYDRVAVVLENLWQESPQVIDNAETIINNNLDSWFRYQALEKLAEVANNNDKLALLRSQEEQLAWRAISKLAFISGIPVMGGISGVILLIFLIVQLLLKKETAILATNSNNLWETPWDWEITWQVLIVGFFFIGQFVLPILLGLSGFNPTNASLTVKAGYVFFTYMLMAVSGILVLYWSIKSFLPLPKDWFKFKFNDNWFAWGFGGYLVAIPLVLIVSLINQQLWQGQGGSNPLLSLALESQNKVALAIFFITASIAAPIFEEIMFRGFLLPSLTRYISVWGAILISSLIFAIAHLSLSEVFPLATLGIILGVVYTRSRNLLASMFLHSLWNSGTLISLFILGGG